MKAERTDAKTASVLRIGARGTRRGTVVILHEVHGVSAHMQRVAADFAAQGYDAFVPALFARAEARLDPIDGLSDLKRGFQLAAATAIEQVIEDLQALIEAQAPEGAHLIGFCYGAGLAWLMACRSQGVVSATGFYGRQIIDFLDETPRAPVLLHYGLRDRHIPPADIQAVAERQPSVRILTYDAGHGFCREDGADYHPQACAAAMMRTRGHLDAAVGRAQAHPNS